MTLASRGADDTGEERVQSRSDFGVEHRRAVLRAEDEVDEDAGERLGHRIAPGLQPWLSGGMDSWGFAPGWYAVAPLALQRGAVPSPSAT